MNPNVLRTRCISLAIIGGLALTACESASSQPAPTSTMIPDLTGFTLDPETCLYGGPRPCAVLIRERPQLSSAILNVDPSQATVAWPFESFGGSTGDALEITCVTEGDPVTTATDQTTTTQWYRVEVPAEQVVNSAFVRPETPYVDGYASIAWFNQTTAPASVPAC